MGFNKNDIEQLLADCGRRCCICGNLHKLQVHHIKPKEYGGTDDIENGIPLCPNCHDEVHTDYSSGKTTRTYSEGELKLHKQRTIGLVNGKGLEKDIETPTLTSITVTPSNSYIGHGSTQQFLATAHYSNGTNAELSTDITWASLNLFSPDSLRSFTPVSINSILLGDLSPLSHEDKLAEARKQFNDISTLAKSGDANAIGAMQSISTIFLTLSRQYYASSVPYFTDFEIAKNVLMEIISICLDTATVTTANAPALASLQAFTHILTLSDLGGLSPECKLTEARNLFTDLTKRAKLGDTKAHWQLETVSAAYLKASNFYFGGGTGYSNDFDSVQRTMLEIQSLKIPITPAAIETNSGLANGIALGTAMITATSKGISGTALLNITIS